MHAQVRGDLPTPRRPRSAISTARQRSRRRRSGAPLNVRSSSVRPSGVRSIRIIAPPQLRQKDPRLCRRVSRGVNEAAARPARHRARRSVSRLMSVFCSVATQSSPLCLQRNPEHGRRLRPVSAPPPRRGSRATRPGARRLTLPTGSIREPVSESLMRRVKNLQEALDISHEIA
jgi:hypothetical protein